MEKNSLLLNDGRIVAIALMLTCIGIFSAITNYLSTMFINRGNQIIKEQTEEQNEAIYQRLIAIEENGIERVQQRPRKAGLL